MADALLDWLNAHRGREVIFAANPGNAGDGFIAHATYILFRRFGINWRRVADTHLKDLRDEVVVLGGGGNLIDGLYFDTARRIEQIDEQNDCVVFPQSVIGFSTLFEAHSRLIVFCREEQSYCGLISKAPVVDARRAHDTTLYLTEGDFDSEHRHQRGSGVASVFRTDRESKLGSVPPDNLDISRSWDGDFWNDVRFAHAATTCMAAYLARYEAVETDRLHVAILAAFLGKKVCLFANSYFKNRAIFDSSLASRFPNVSFID